MARPKKIVETKEIVNENVSLLDSIKQENSITKEIVNESKAVIQGEPYISIVFEGKEVERVYDAGFDKWCLDKQFTPRNVREIINKHWVNHNGYTFTIKYWEVKE